MRTFRNEELEYARISCFDNRRWILVTVVLRVVFYIAFLKNSANESCTNINVKKKQLRTPPLFKFR